MNTKQNLLSVKFKKEYDCWYQMMQRCYNINCKAYKHYGGRGIKVCDRWHKFELFLLDVGKRPSNYYSLDRYPNNNGDYEPTNFRWADKRQQNNNTRKNILITWKGKTQTIRQWSEELKISHPLLSRRVHYSKMTIEQIFTIPKGYFTHQKGKPSHKKGKTFKPK